MRPTRERRGGDLRENTREARRPGARRAHRCLQRQPRTAGRSPRGLAPISVVQVALSILDDTALRGGIVERCADVGIALIAHTPLGGPRRVGRLPREEPLAAIAHERGVSPAELALAWLLDLAPNVVAIPGARQPETAARPPAARRCASTSASAHGSAARPPRPLGGAGRGDVVIVMGPPELESHASPRTTPRVDTSGSTATRAAGRSGSSPTRWTG